MNPALGHGAAGAPAQDRAHALSGQVMWYVAAAAGFFAGLTMFDFQRLRRSRSN